ncbi:hypothetical protein [Bradyrhizobium sp. JR3.5]
MMVLTNSRPMIAISIMTLPLIILGDVVSAECFRPVSPAGENGFAGRGPDASLSAGDWLYRALKSEHAVGNSSALGIQRSLKNREGRPWSGLAMPA